MNQVKRIGFFDSGVGGLSVLRHAPARIGSADYIYVADAAYAPYGKQTEEFILQRSLLITEFLVAQDIDALVIACNTATAVSIDAIRERYALPVIGMEPAIKPAVDKSSNKKVAVLGTENTLRSRRYKDLKDQYTQVLQVYERACHDWVEIVEENNLDKRTIQKYVDSYIQPLIEKDVDTFILACTHFPFLRDHIERSLPPGSCVIDPAEAVIEQLAQRLEIKTNEIVSEVFPRLNLYSSMAIDQMTVKLKTRLMKWTVDVMPLKLQD